MSAKIIIFLRQEVGGKQVSLLKQADTDTFIIWACLSGRAIHFSPRRQGCLAMWRQRAPLSLLPPQPSQALPSAGCRSYPSCGGQGSILICVGNKGWVNVGITKDTAEFAVQSIRNWWYKMGIYYNNAATSLLITADGGGSNSSKGKLWKYELQKFANETGMEVTVLHFPPGTSKWNKIEHRLFSYISKNWRGKPLISYEVIVKLISSTKTKTGLDIVKYSPSFRPRIDFS